MTSAADLADELAELRRRVKTLERAPRLANASIEGHPLLVNDGDQQLRQTIGLQADGTYTVVDTNGPPPPVPSPPILEARAGTLVVTWDGTFAGQVAAPADWDHVEVHVFTVPGYVPNDSTEVITFHSLKGGSVTLALNPVAQYVVLQAVNTSRVESAPTAQVAGTPLPAATGAGGVKTYLETDPPIGLGAADDGALWYDTNDANHPYRWSGSGLAWVSIRDGSIATAAAAASSAQTQANSALTAAQAAQATADGAIRTYYQANPPWADGSSQPPEVLGDMWFDTDTNIAYRWSGTAWQAIQDNAISAALAAAQNAQTTADGKIDAFYQTATPTTGRLGDLWYDTDDGNKPYFCAQELPQIWTPIRDATIAAAQAAAANALTAAQTAQTTADGKAVAYFQPAEPTGQVPGDVGDLWFDTDDGNKMYRWSGSAWVVAQDQSIATALTNAAAASTAAGVAQSTADSKIVTLYQTAAPSGAGRTVGDLWVDTDDGNHLYRWDGAAWVSVRDTTIATASAAASSAQTQANTALTAAQAAQATADGAIRTYYTATAPTGLNATSDVGDLWFNTTDQSAHRWNGTAWVLIQDTSIATALAAAQNAQTTADGKITAYYQTSPPTVGEVGDLWYDTDDKNKPYFCSTASAPGPVVWTVVQDLTIADAQAAANAAQAAANTAQAAATSDGIVPASSPTPIAMSGIESVVLRWTAITNRDPVRYDVHASPTTGFAPVAGTLAGTTQGTQFTIRELPGAAPVNPGDPDPRKMAFGTTYYFRLVARDADGPAAAGAEVAGSVFQVPSGYLAADVVGAREVISGSFVGDEFAGEVFIGSQFKTAADGQRVEWGVNGIAGYRADNTRRFNVPTNDGEDIFLDAQIVARGLQVKGGASFEGIQNEITKDGSLNLSTGVTSPSGQPQIAVDYEMVRPDTVTVRSGLLGSFALIPGEVQFIAFANNKINLYQHRPGGTRIWRFLRTGAYDSHDDFTDYQFYGETFWDGTGSGTWLAKWIANGNFYVNRSSGGFNHYTRLNTSRIPTIGSDGSGTRFFIAETIPNGSGVDQIDIRYRTGLAAAFNAELPAATTSFKTDTTRSYGGAQFSVEYGTFDGGAARYAVSGVGDNFNSRVFGTAGAWDAGDQDWPSPGGVSKRGFCYDGTNFWTYGVDGWLYKHTSLTWSSTTSAVWWSQLTLKDTVGTTHETTPGPIRGLNMKKRSRLKVTLPPVPYNGDVEDPNAWGFYLGISPTTANAQPTNVQMWLQQDVPAGTSQVFTSTRVTTGANPPTANNFPGATPGRIRSPTDNLVISGDGSILGNVFKQFGSTLNADLSDTGWVNLTINAGFAFRAGFAGQIRRIGNVVFMKGQVDRTVGTWTSGTPSPLTIPVGFRPIAQHDFVYMVSSNASPSVGTAIQAYVSAAGAVNSLSSSAAPTGNTMGLSNTWLTT